MLGQLEEENHVRVEIEDLNRLRFDIATNFGGLGDANRAYELLMQLKENHVGVEIEYLNKLRFAIATNFGRLGGQENANRAYELLGQLEEENHVGVEIEYLNRLRFDIATNFGGLGGQENANRAYELLGQIGYRIVEEIVEEAHTETGEETYYPLRRDNIIHSILPSNTEYAESVDEQFLPYLRSPERQKELLDNLFTRFFTDPLVDEEKIKPFQDNIKKFILSGDTTILEELQNSLLKSPNIREYCRETIIGTIEAKNSDISTVIDEIHLGGIQQRNESGISKKLIDFIKPVLATTEIEDRLSQQDQQRQRQ